MSADELEILRAILREIQALRQETKSRQFLSHSEHLLLDRLLPALAGRYGSGVFTSAEIANDSIFRTLLMNGAADSQSLGNLLAKSVGMDINGLEVRRGPKKIDHNKQGWFIVRILD